LSELTRALSASPAYAGLFLLADLQPHATDEVRQMLRQLFDAGAAKSLAVICTLDAEPEMARFLHAVKAHPEQRAFVVQLLIDSFSDSFYMKWAPSHLVQFCMYDLRWPEIRHFITAKREEDAQRRGAACSGVWNEILDAFEDKWEAAKYFQEFKNREQTG
jgi:hypothetical protein